MAETKPLEKGIFIAYLLGMFFNAFVDLGHKIVIQNTVFKIYDGQTQVVLIAIVNSLILLPYILLFTASGYLSTRFAKARIMRFSAGLAVVFAALITLFYVLGWYQAAFLMTLMMGMQSAVYSPAKFGYLRELLGQGRLGWGNGYVQAVTITAILAGTFAFSLLFEWRYLPTMQNEAEIVREMWPLGILLVLSAVLEFWVISRLPVIDPGLAKERFDWRAYFRGQMFRRNVQTLRAHPKILSSALGLAGFWGISQMALATFPAVAKFELQELNTAVIQGTLAMAGVGILVGSLLAGRLSRVRIQTALIPLGAVGFGVSLALVPTLGTQFGYVLAFLSIGFFGALFIVPSNALVQYHANQAKIGRTLAAINWVQNVSMLLFLIWAMLGALMGFEPRLAFYLMAFVAGLGALWFIWRYRLPLARFVLTGLFRLRYRVAVQGRLPENERSGLLLLGNHLSWIDWALLQLACAQRVRYVVDRKYHDMPVLGWWIRFSGAIPISPRGSRQALSSVHEYLKAGEVVALFPEGGISRDGALAGFRPGFERAVRETGATVVPFALVGIWGSVFSRAPFKLTFGGTRWPRRKVLVRFGERMNDEADAETVRSKVVNLLSLD